jgi:hypothetical protein
MVSRENLKFPLFENKQKKVLQGWNDRSKIPAVLMEYKYPELIFSSVGAEMTKK